jgi:hypothetical protein
MSEDDINATLDDITRHVQELRAEGSALSDADKAALAEVNATLNKIATGVRNKQIDDVVFGGTKRPLKVRSLRLSKKTGDNP